MDWENAKVFIAVARAGTLAGAGRALNVTHSTVLRRVTSLEEGLGVKLFERHPTGYVLTDAGQEMLDGLHPVEDSFAEIERGLSGRDQRLSGTVRVAIVPAFGPWVCEALADFRIQHPKIVIEMDTSSDVLSLPHYEADIAVRVSRNPSESLVGHRIATLAHGVYASNAHPAVVAGPPDLAGHDWIGYDQSRSDTPQARWIAENVPKERIITRTNSTDLMKTAAQLGLGVAVLPCYLGDSTPSLQRLRLIQGLGAELWLLTHRDLRQTPRVKVTMAHLAARLSRYRPLIEGQSERRISDAPSGRDGECA